MRALGDAFNNLTAFNEKIRGDAAKSNSAAAANDPYDSSKVFFDSLFEDSQINSAGIFSEHAYGPFLRSLMLVLADAWCSNCTNQVHWHSAWRRHPM